MNATPGWYPDSAAGALRYWDGVAWTAHLHPHPVPGPDQEHFAEPEAMPHIHPAVQQYAPPVVPQYAPPATQAYAQPGYAPAYVRRGTGEPNGMAIAGFIIGLASIFMPLFVGLAVGVTGLVLSIIGSSRSLITGTGKGLAITGIIASIFGIIFLL